MQTPRFLRLPLSFALVVALACDENAPTETRVSALATQAGAGDQVEGLPRNEVSAMAISLPVDQDVATAAPAPAFRVNQTGTGPNGIFQISRSTNTQTALQGLTNGRGLAGFFRIQNTGNVQAALMGQTNGEGWAVHGRNTGPGGAGLFEVLNSASVRTSLLAYTNGTGIAAAFSISKPANVSPAVYVNTSGRGPAGRFESFNASNSSNALEVSSRNQGRTFAAVQTGTGRGGNIQINNPSNSTTALTVQTNGTGPALVVVGRSIFQGTVTKPAGSFRIDHPLDPEHQYLSHSFVESPDMMNVYNGNVTLDASGRATVELPDYFEALNRDFRYQLTAIGAPGPNLYIAEGVKQTRFRIAGGRPYAHVSWQVTGVRQDTYANEHRIKVEEKKPPAEQDMVAHR